MKNSIFIKGLMAGARLATKAVINLIKSTVVCSIAAIVLSLLADVLIIHGKKN